MTNAILSKNTTMKKGNPQRMAPPKGRSPLLSLMSEDTLRGRDVLSMLDFSVGELNLVLAAAELLKTHKFDDTQTMFAKGQTLAMLFEKPSLRTRVTFEAGMIQLGGSAINLEGKLGERECVKDVAKNLDRWLDGIMARVFDHKTLQELAQNAKVPIINGLSDLEHPCQTLADLLTIKEKKGELGGLKIAFVGDGNNVANSLALASGMLGIDFVIACPSGYEPDKTIWARACAIAEKGGSLMSISNDPAAAVVDADVIYTDTWTSMGQEAESKLRAQVFEPFQVNDALVSMAKSDAIVMHCLPAHRGQEITDSVIDGPQSVVYDQAENRLHAQKAVLSLVL